ncbi:MAG: class I SAM-dependent methyltransferase, partial [Pseudomonadota bacterium]
MALRHLQSKLRRSAYSAAQFAKVGWYTTQYIGARHISGPLTPPGEVPKPFQSAPTSQAALRKAFLHLLAQEARDIEKGVYKLPKAFRTPPSPLRLAKQAKSYFKEARAVAVRSKTKGGATEVRNTVEGDYPSYYLQNFHFQTDGWLSESSAKIYDTQVEALFTGAAAPMRRRLLPPLLTEVAKLQEKDVSIHIADIGCGTGRLVAEIVDNTPNVKITGIDLSKAYLDVARDYVGTEKSVSFVKGAAETLPFEDDSVDILTSVYL